MLAIAALVLALFSAGLTFVLARFLAEDRKEFREELARLKEAVALGSAASTPQLPAFNPLEGLRVGISVEQDHAKSTFAELLQSRLAAEDAEGFIASPGDDGFDVMVRGSLVCNGYADVYYAADLVCLAGGEVVMKISEKPADGGRQANLAAGLVGRLKKDLEQSTLRAERRKALREIRGGM